MLSLSTSDVSYFLDNKDTNLLNKRHRKRFMAGRQRRVKELGVKKYRIDTRKGCLNYNIFIKSSSYSSVVVLKRKEEVLYY